MGKIYAVEGEFHEVVPNIRLLLECEVISGFYIDLLNIYIKIYNLESHQINGDLIFKNYNTTENIITNKLNLQGKILLNNVSFKYINDEENLQKNDNIQVEENLQKNDNTQANVTLNENLQIYNDDNDNINKNDSYVFKNLNLIFEENKTTAIFGPSGCGKSTLIKLILRLYDLEPNNGQILIDDRIDLHSLKFDISNKSELTLKNFRKNIGYVEQRPMLLNDTIRNNILVGRPNISDEAIYEKLQLLKMGKFIKSLDNHLDYIVGQNGNKLSGGQKQRIVIARALIENPNILILDEATSALDDDNVVRINNIINSLKGTKTIIFSTHDIRLLKKVDKIIMFNNDGAILEQGSPEELIKENGLFAKEIKDRFLEEEKIINEEEDEDILNTNNIQIKNIENNKNDKVFTGFICSLFGNKLYFFYQYFLC